jgi:aminodeoxyfutalosine synthase
VNDVRSNDKMSDICSKVRAGERLDFDDGMFLYSSNDLPALGGLANSVRERMNGNYTYYNVNTHLNATNICLYRCIFCAFRADLKSPKGYAMSDSEIADRAAEAHARGATEIHIVGGLHHQMPFDWYVGVIRVVHQAAPELHIKAYTAVEMNWFKELTGLPYGEILQTLVDAGLGSLPGGGAEIFHPEVRDKICEHKADATEWLEIHRTAHSMGLNSNATMLYGHIERPEHRIDHLIRLRALQDETRGFQTFIPLAFHPENTKLDYIKKPSGLADLKTMAISRLMLDNFPHIKAYWIMLGMKTAQIAQSFGSDDLDGTVVHEKIYHDAGAQTPQELTVAEIEALIRETGREPVERDTLYHRVERDSGGWRAAEPIAVGAR